MLKREREGQQTLGVTDSKRTFSDSSDSCKSSATIKIKGVGSQKRRTKGETTDAEKKKRKEKNGETASSRAKNRGSREEQDKAKREEGRRPTRCPEQLVSSSSSFSPRACLCQCHSKFAIAL